MLFHYQLGRPQRHPLPRPSFALNTGARHERPDIGVSSSGFHGMCWRNSGDGHGGDVVHGTGDRQF
jgi:hypothetical protein